MLWPEFVNGAYATRYAIADAEALVNAYVDTINSRSNAKRAFLTGTPGMKVLFTLPTIGCRGWWTADGRTLTVYGDTFYEVDITNKLGTAQGTIPNDGQPVSMVSNGRGGEQVLVVGGGNAYIYDLRASTLSAPIALPLTNAPVMADFIDGYFLLTERNTIRTWYSALENGTSWPALNFFSRSQVTDNTVGLKVVNGRIQVFGSLTTESFYDSGDVTTPFLPVPGSILQQGAMSPWAISRQGDGVIWLAQSSEASGRITGTSGVQQTSVSTPAIEFAISQYSTLTDAEVLVYGQEGHQFAAFTFPSGDATWVNDAREDQWHRRDNWNLSEGQSHRWRARGSCVVNGQVIVGDYASGDVCALDLNTFQDRSAVIRRVRRAPYLSAENQWLFLDQIELGVQAGRGLATGQGSDPQVLLSISRDGGSQWDRHAPPH